MRLAAPDVPSFPYNKGLEDYCLPNAEMIAGDEAAGGNRA
jgi:hypothetical protein